MTTQTTPAARTTRCGTYRGRSLYRVESRRPAPTFDKGDGRDNGRNLLSALLIGPSWMTVGYVAGKRGDWVAYPEWPTPSTRRRPAVMPVAGTQGATVAESACLLLSRRGPVAT